MIGGGSQNNQFSNGFASSKMYARNHDLALQNNDHFYSNVPEGENVYAGYSRYKRKSANNYNKPLTLEAAIQNNRRHSMLPGHNSHSSSMHNPLSSSRSSAAQEQQHKAAILDNLLRRGSRKTNSPNIP